MYRYGDYVFAKMAPDSHRKTISNETRERLPTVGLPKDHTIPYLEYRGRKISEAFAKVRELKSTEKWKREELARRKAEDWNDSLNPLWTPRQLQQYREYHNERTAELRHRLEAEDSFLQELSEDDAQEGCAGS